MSIILDHINYCYSADSAYKVQALKDVSLEINDGEFIGIIGHTGSGKSTLIQHMNGLLKATSGHIYYNGQDIYDNDYDLSKLRHKVGMVFQYPEHQLFETTNFEDVCFGPKNQGLDRKTVELRAYEALQNVHFPEDLYYQPPFDLSGGQKRRVAIAGVLAMHPDVLILDEPTAGLDPAGRDEILGLLLQMNRRGFSSGRPGNWSCRMIWMEPDGRQPCGPWKSSAIWECASASYPCPRERIPMNTSIVPVLINSARQWIMHRTYSTTCS